MEHTDRDLILNGLKDNTQLRRLYDEHLVLEGRLTDFGRKPFLTPEEELEERRLKKLKLLGVDRMMAIVADRRHTN